MPSVRRAEADVFQHQADATLDQAAPIQDQWYTILNTTRNVRVIGVVFWVATTGEDLELRITVDGQTLTASPAAAADTEQYVIHNKGGGITYTTTNILLQVPSLLEGRSVKVDMRKTSANGAGNLKGLVIYAKVP